MGLRLFVLFVVFGSTNIAYAEGVVNVVDMVTYSEPDPAAERSVANADAPSVVRVFSQLDSAPTESQQQPSSLAEVQHTIPSTDGKATEKPLVY